MKILAINASHRGNQGSTHFMLQLLFQGAKSAGADCEEVILTKQKINRCLACGHCNSEDTLHQCVYIDKDDMQSIHQKMAAADIIIYATPIYVFGMSGLLKTFLDRLYAKGDSRDLRLSACGLMFHQIDPAVCSKPFVPLICCSNFEDETPRNVISYFKTFSRFMDAPQVGCLVRKGGLLFGDNQNPEYAIRFPRITQIYAAYEQAGRELAQDGIIHRKTMQRANQPVLSIPGFSILMRLPFRPVKKMILQRATKMKDELISHKQKLG